MAPFLKKMLADFNMKGCTSSNNNHSESFGHVIECKATTRLCQAALQTEVLCCCDGVSLITHSGLEDVHFPAALFDCGCLSS